MVLDLNGTLTEGNVSISKLTVYDRTLLPYIAQLEAHSNHPIAEPIQAHIHKTMKLKSLKSVSFRDIDTCHHAAISEFIHGKKLLIGNEKFLKAHRIIPIAKPYKNPSNCSIYFVYDGKVVGQEFLDHFIQNCFVLWEFQKRYVS